MKIKIFWQINCPHCSKAIEIGKIMEEEVKVKYYDIGTTEGLTEACLNNIMSTPSIVITDEKECEIDSWRGMVPEIGSIRKKISDK